MLDRQTFQQLTDTIRESLVEGHLNNALSLLSNILDIQKSPNLKREASNIQADYDRLLHYMAEGSVDTQRDILYNRFILKAFRILQNIRYNYHIDNEKDYFAFMARTIRPIWKEQFDISTTQLKSPLTFDQQDYLFDLIWLSAQLNTNEERQLRLFLIATDSRLRCYLLNALTISSLHFFDAAKLRLLLEYAVANETDENGQVCANATVGVIVCCILYAPIIPLFPQIYNSIQKLLQTSSFIGAATQVQHIFCLYQEVERFRQKMEQEIFPTLIKASQEQIRFGFNVEDEQTFLSPETELRLSKEERKKISESAQEMFQMFQEGVDINLHTFVALKGFHFFHRLCHWVAPFDEKRPGIVPHPLLRKMQLCDSDMYSIALLAEKIPEKQRNEMEQMIKEKVGEEDGHVQPVNLSPYRNIIQCLFRLLRRSPWSAMWPDVFALPPFIDNPILGPTLSKSPTYIHDISQTLYRHKQFEQAEKHFKHLLQIEGSHCELLCKIAYCHEQQKQYAKAIRYLQEALMLEPDNMQALYHIQSCHGHLSQYKQQLEYLLQLEKKTPDEPRILTDTGLCLMQLQRWEEAQKRFYKMEYKNLRVVPSKRAIAWCALQSQDYPLAERYYKNIMEETPTQSRWDDYLNIAHTYWLQGNMSLAVSHYIEYAHRYMHAHPDHTDALSPFLTDSDMLQKHGKSLSDIRLMHDLISQRL